MITITNRPTPQPAQAVWRALLLGGALVLLSAGASVATEDEPPVETNLGLLGEAAADLAVDAVVPPPPLPPLEELLAMELEGGLAELSGEVWRNLQRFYDRRQQQSVWLDSEGLRPVASEWLVLLRRAGRHGLNPARYRLEEIEQLAVEEGPAKRVQLELLLSRAFLLYIGDLHSGRYEVDRKAQDWHIATKPVDPVSYLERALRGEFTELVAAAAPQHSAYQRLRDALARYRQIEADGGWPQIDSMIRLKLGSNHPQVQLLRQRLYLEGDLEQASDSMVFDPELEAAVIGFQQRYALDADGVVGRRTIETLNVSVELRIEQLILNMERWRWMPRKMESRYLQVNLADFSLSMVEADHSLFGMKVIIGKAYSETPVFSGEIKYLVVNPYWNVPKRIAIEGLLPKQREDSEYFVRKGIRALERVDLTYKEVPLNEIDWTSLGWKHFPYRLRQDPGEKNSLGRIKFIFPNRFDVYLHDTPAQDLFNKGVRAFSGGCIRVAQPLKLADYLMGETWSAERLEEAIEARKNRRLNLPQSIPIYITYMTVWVDEEGQVQFRNDIYGRDRRLAKQLSVINGDDNNL